MPLLAQILRSAALLAVTLALAAGARAEFHLFNVEQVFSNADGTVQFIVMLQTPNQNAEHLWRNHSISTTHEGAVRSFTFPNNLPSGATAGKRVLIATQGFAALGILAPDYVVPNGFVPTSGGLINYADQDFFGYGSLPTDGVMAINRSGAPIPNVATNFAGQSASVAASPIPPPLTLVNSVLPSSRTVAVGTTATVFNTVINAGANLASGITVSMDPAPPPGVFAYRQTDCATNAVIGPPNPSLDLAPNGVLCYVLSFTPSQAFPATELHISARASNAPATSILPGINTWLLRATDTPGPDAIALATTTDFHQAACSGAGAFAVAVSNVGASAGDSAAGFVNVTAHTGGATLPVSVSIAETNPATGAVVGDAVLRQLHAGDTRTVAAFVSFNGCVAFDPAAHRIFIEFRDIADNVIGSTSTAVSTNR